MAPHEMQSHGHGCILAMLRWIKTDNGRDQMRVEALRSFAGKRAGRVSHILRTLPKDISPHIRIRVLYCVGRSLLIHAGAWDEAWEVVEPIWRAIEGDHVTPNQVMLSVEMQDRVYSMIGVDHVE